MPRIKYNQYGGADCRDPGKSCNRPSGSGRCQIINGQAHNHGCVCNPDTGNCVLVKNNRHLEYQLEKDWHKERNFKSSGKSSTITKSKVEKPDAYQESFRTRVSNLVRNPRLFLDHAGSGIVPSYEDQGGGGDCQFRVLANIAYDNKNRFDEVRQNIANIIRQNGPCYPRWYFEADPYNTTLENFCYNIEKNRGGKNRRSWGDHITLQAFCNIYGYAIILISDRGTITITEPMLTNHAGDLCPPPPPEIENIILQGINPETNKFDNLDRFRVVCYYDDVHYVGINPSTLQPTRELVDYIREIETSVYAEDGSYVRRARNVTYQDLIDHFHMGQIEHDDKSEIGSQSHSHSPSSVSISSYFGEDDTLTDLQQQRHNLLKQLEDLDHQKPPKLPRSESNDFKIAMLQSEQLYQAEQIKEQLFELDVKIMTLEPGIPKTSPIVPPSPSPSPPHPSLAHPLISPPREVLRPAEPINCNECNSPKLRFKEKRECCTSDKYKGSCKYTSKKLCHRDQKLG